MTNRDEVSRQRDKDGQLSLAIDEAERAWQEGRKDEAVRLLEDLLQARPRHARLHALLGMLYMQLGDLGRANVHLEQAAVLEPRHEHPKGPS